MHTVWISFFFKNSWHVTLLYKKNKLKLMFNDNWLAKLIFINFFVICLMSLLIYAKKRLSVNVFLKKIFNQFLKNRLKEISKH